jgi:hypothetical protein
VRYQAKGVLRGTRVRCETSCRRQFAQATLLEEGDRFRIPGGTVGTCASGMSVLFPDQVGTIGHRRNGALVLETTNLADIAQAATRCRGQTVRLRAGPTVLRPGATAGVLNGVERTSTRIQDTIPVVISATSRVRLTRRSEASPTAPSSSPAFRHLRDCPDSIRLRCVAD